MNACPGPHSGRDSPVPGREQSCPEGKQASSVLFHVNSQECDPQRLEIGSTRRGTAELQETHKLKIRGHSRGSQGQIGKEAAALGRELERLEGQTALADEGARAGQSKGRQRTVFEALSRSPGHTVAEPVPLPLQMPAPSRRILLPSSPDNARSTEETHSWHSQDLARKCGWRKSASH
nr:uncharacterized protein LOC101787837 isoform X3 [Cavia porcellus]